MKRSPAPPSSEEAGPDLAAAGESRPRDDRAARPKVSVAMITYNHERYVAQAIESVLMQETNFPVELVIGEDCSTDGTRAVASSFQRKYPEIISLRDRPENIGHRANFIDTVQACRGEFIAMLDGDDYWTSPHKLQKQVDFLERHPRFSMSCHAAEERHERGDRKSFVTRPQGKKRVYRLADFAEWVIIQTSSVLFRRTIQDLPAWYTNVSVGDWALFVLSALHGPVGYVDEVMSAHRRHSDGLWTEAREDRVKALHSNIEMVKHFIDNLPRDRVAPFVRALYRRYWELAHAYADRGDEAKAREVAQKCVAEKGRLFRLRIAPTEPWSLYLNLHAPKLYRVLPVLRHWGRRVRNRLPS